MELVQMAYKLHRKKRGSVIGNTKSGIMTNIIPHATCYRGKRSNPLQFLEILFVVPRTLGYS